MYYLLGFKSSLETVATVTRKFVEKHYETLSVADFKKSYIEFTRYIQPDIPKQNHSHEVCFVKDDKLLDQLIKIFLDANSNGDHETISGFQFEKVQDKDIVQNKYHLVMDAVNKIRENTPEFGFLFELLFSYVFLIQSNNIACATIPKAMGILLLDHRTWGIPDLCEMIVHETTHQLVTLDEYRYGHYNDMAMLAQPENFAISAMRATSRPVNKVLHSLVVASEIIAYRHAIASQNTSVNVHPTTHIILEQIKQTIESIKKSENINTIMTPRAKQIIGLVEDQINMLS